MAFLSVSAMMAFLFWPSMPSWANAALSQVEGVPPGVAATSMLKAARVAEGTCEGPGEATARKNEEKSCGQDDRELFSVIDWIRSKGGFISYRIEITRDGIFAKQDIPKSDLIMAIPPGCFISNDVGLEPYSGLQCGTAQTLLDEMNRGTESMYAPYLKFLESQPKAKGQVPSLWSQQGKKLLLELLGFDEHSGSQTLPPGDSIGWVDEEWIDGCKEGIAAKQHPLENELVMYVLQHGWGEQLVPLLDVMNHRTGQHWLNTRHNAYDPHPQRGVEIMSTRLIRAGEQLYTDYGERVPELFRDCGVVAEYPQSWGFYYPQQVFFTLDHALYDANGGVTSDELVLIWDDEPLLEQNVEVLEFFHLELVRLQAFGQKHLISPGTVPTHEWTSLAEYHAALVVAISMLLEEVQPAGECSLELGEQQNCVVSPDRYDPLDEPFDDSFLKTDTCDQPKELDHSHYVVLEEFDSQYQSIKFLEDPVNKDMCFSLDTIFQICHKYRPHYHEPVVHYSARFVDEIKRVIFIGGGDSMLLHEVLKYETLEFVVGLEIDQKVTRSSFKYFGTSPHWDDDRVMWIFGDAAKSLLMLPKEYFGTFDLVLVDLSETVMSKTVTEELDIMSALSLLLKEDGIFLKNEMYFKQFTEVFKHTIQIHYYDVPLVCSQCLVMGSNKVDFIKTPLKDHKVETIHQPVIELDHEFGLVHDYMTNRNAARHCAEDNDEVEPQIQEMSPGMFMVLEAEIASDVPSLTEVRSVILSALKKEGLTPLQASAVPGRWYNGSITTVVLEEGYVVARTFPNPKYVAFDIHFISKFEKQEAAKKALLAAVGSRTKSSFRIAAGGMFGVSTWKEDNKARGPKFTQFCNDDSVESSKAPVSVDEDAVVNTILEESLNFLLPGEAVTVAVLCGPRGESCESIDVLSDQPSVDSVIQLWACPAISGKNPTLEQTFSCEKDIYATMKARVKGGDKVGAVVVDPSTTFEMAQIMRSIVSKRKLRQELMTKDLLAIASTWDHSDTWRSFFVDHLREFFDNEPGFKSTVFFNSSNITGVEVTTFSSGDQNFITHLKECTSSIEKRTGLVGDIHHIGGVEYSMQYNFEPSQFFNATDYDRRDAYAQWLSQQPVGYQVLFQLEGDASRLSHQVVRGLLNSALSLVSSPSIKLVVEEFTSLGDGSIMTVAWLDGNVVVLYNGRDHVDVNLFTREEDFEFANRFGEQFTMNSALSVALRDDMPRGYGRVVNFLMEVEPRHEPHWAFAVED